MARAHLRGEVSAATTGAPGGTGGGGGGHGTGSAACSPLVSAKGGVSPLAIGAIGGGAAAGGDGTEDHHALSKEGLERIRSERAGRKLVAELSARDSARAARLSARESARSATPAPAPAAVLEEVDEEEASAQRAMAEAMGGTARIMAVGRAADGSVASHLRER